MLTDTLRVLVYKIVLENFLGKKKKTDFLNSFYMSHEMVF